MLPTLLGSGNNLTISIENGTYVLAYGSEALISGPPVQACNVSGQCLQAFSTHACMHLCVVGAMWRVGERSPSQHVLHMGHPDFPPGGCCTCSLGASHCHAIIGCLLGHGGTNGFLIKASQML